jgi:2-oxoglutarate ferredoxin oxidoreductase subunit beta
MGPPDFPIPLGVFRAVDKPVYSQLLTEQVRTAQAEKAADLEALFRQGETWDVPDPVDGETR